VTENEAKETTDNPKLVIERVQIGVRLEKRMVKVLKALAEYHDVTLGDLLEGLVLHAFENKPVFNAETLKRLAQIKEVYGMDYDSTASHQFSEK
jgi:predicted DNA-binding ribbon-helix-helix protein